MSPDPITVETQDEITVVKMDDGKVNALSTTFLADLAARVEKATSAGTPVVLTGNQRAFSAGLDLTEVPTLDREGLGELIGSFERVLHPILATDVPVIAAIDGFAIAGGAIIALSCDYRVGSPTAEIGATELRVGIPLPPSDLSLFTARLPAHTIRRTIMDPNRVSGEEAVALGWLDEVTTDALAGAMERAGTIGGTNRQAFANVKAHMNEPILESWESFLEGGGLEEYLDLLTSEQTQEAIFEGIQSVMG